MRIIVPVFGYGRLVHDKRFADQVLGSHERVPAALRGYARYEIGNGFYDLQQDTAATTTGFLFF